MSKRGRGTTRDANRRRDRHARAEELRLPRAKCSWGSLRASIAGVPLVGFDAKFWPQSDF